MNWREIPPSTTTIKSTPSIIRSDLYNYRFTGTPYQRPRPSYLDITKSTPTATQSLANLIKLTKAIPPKTMPIVPIYERLNVEQNTQPTIMPRTVENFSMNNSKNDNYPALTKSLHINTNTNNVTDLSAKVKPINNDDGNLNTDSTNFAITKTDEKYDPDRTWYSPNSPQIKVEQNDSDSNIPCGKKIIGEYKIVKEKYRQFSHQQSLKQYCLLHKLKRRHLPYLYNHLLLVTHVSDIQNQSGPQMPPSLEVSLQRVYQEMRVTQTLCALKTEVWNQYLWVMTALDQSTAQALP